ncbi:MAG: hypothetical protein ACRBB0_12890 [Pelagimonas sp.]|uniref:hypothetical protein n=1 Tax=Pelagimonas sp. TaxID=2073170 RepID=UPI003D6BE75A
MIRVTSPRSIEAGDKLLANVWLLAEIVNSSEPALPEPAVDVRPEVEKVCASAFGPVTGISIVQLDPSASWPLEKASVFVPSAATSKPLQDVSAPPAAITKSPGSVPENAISDAFVPEEFSSVMIIVVTASGMISSGKKSTEIVGPTGAATDMTGNKANAQATEKRRSRRIMRDFPMSYQKKWFPRISQVTVTFSLIGKK